MTIESSFSSLQNCYYLAGFVTELRFYEDNFILVVVHKFTMCKTNLESSINIRYYLKRQKRLSIGIDKAKYRICR